MEDLMNPVAEICRERSRQIEVEGFEPINDDRYTNGELATAAACYAEYAALGDDMTMEEDELGRPAPPGWPWCHSWWKPTSKHICLVKAGALIVAEMERLNRAAK